MDIAIFAPGSRGDVQPYIALALGLKQAGHHPRIVTNSEFKELVNSYGLECWSVDIGVQAALQSDRTRAAIDGGGLIRSFIELSRIAKRGNDQLAEVGLEAARGVQLIISGFGGLFMAYSIAEKLQLPLIQAYNVPITPTSEFSGALMPQLPFGKSLNRLTHRLTRQMLWFASRAAGNASRMKALGLSAAPVIGPFDAGMLNDLPVLYGISSLFLPKPKDWNEATVMTGWWFADEPAGWLPDEKLVAFLKAGPTPVCIGFGSMSYRNARQTSDLVLAALKISGQRGVLLSGWGGLHGKDVPEDVFIADNVPHAWLFPKVSVVVHHGGAGTTAAGVRAGIPSVILPFHGDQPFWARCVHHLGMGPQPITRRKLTANNLALAINQAIGDGRMRDRAHKMGTCVRSENGVARAVEAIEMAIRRSDA